MGEVAYLEFDDGDGDDGEYLILACSECGCESWQVTPDAVFICDSCESVYSMSEMFIPDS
jgi:hypothetical protein